MEEISINRPFLSLSAERWISLGCGAGNCGCLNRADMVSFARTLADLHGGHVPGFACGRNAACIQWRCDAGLNPLILRSQMAKREVRTGTRTHWRRNLNDVTAFISRTRGVGRISKPIKSNRSQPK